MNQSVPIDLCAPVFAIQQLCDCHISNNDHYTFHHLQTHTVYGQFNDIKVAGDMICVSQTSRKKTQATKYQCHHKPNRFPVMDLSMKKKQPSYQFIFIQTPTQTEHHITIKK